MDEPAFVEQLTENPDTWGDKQQLEIKGTVRIAAFADLTPKHDDEIIKDAVIMPTITVPDGSHEGPTE